MTPLSRHLAAQITALGPMTLANFMQQCLLDPTHGYYATRDPFGASGDFTTAPEISQMFGELVGLSLAQSWLDQGAPKPFILAELGPGRGTLMRDIWRATAHVPGFHDAAKVTLVEASSIMRATQAQTLRAVHPIWVDTTADLPSGPLFLVANEFFDALPIRQFIRHNTGWVERVIGLDRDQFVFGQTPHAPLTDLSHRWDDTVEYDMIEICKPGQIIATIVGERIATHGGAALIIDYGDWRSLGDTLQALQNHEPTDPLLAPGEADLTAHVDFEALAKAASPAYFSRLTPQGTFLERLGITERARALAKNIKGTGLKSHVAAHRRLTHPSEMGSLFKVLGLFPNGALPPPGLEK
jgi:NADH dehydrogenase [ubiquinone] 1 alpha subcomplex assembly factor 7